MTCRCGKPFVNYSDGGRTLVGFIRDPRSKCEKYHDDNCSIRYYSCEDKHYTGYSLIPKCECGWSGMKECFCSKRVEEWPKIGGEA